MQRKSLPGLLKVNVHFALAHAMEPLLNEKSWLRLDATNYNGNKFCEPGAYDHRLETSFRVVALEQGIGKLSLKQREIILQTVVGDLSLKEYSEQAGICYSAAYRLQCRALRILKKYL